jgi:hypothetical protein
MGENSSAVPRAECLDLLDAGDLDPRAWRAGLA